MEEHNHVVWWRWLWNLYISTLLRPANCWWKLNCNNNYRSHMGACLAGYVPISALVPSLVKEDKGAAMSILNLGAGLCVFVGPAIVTAFYGLVGPAGVTWILSGLYFASTIMMIWVKLPNNARTIDSVESSESATTPS